MSNLRLSKEQTITEHRKMWNWLADHYEAGKFVSKSDYFKENGIEIDDVPLSKCYCCDFAYYNDRNLFKPVCDGCPVNWGIYHRCDEYNSLWFCYERIMHFIFHRPSTVSDIEIDNKLKELAIISRQIANIPEKEVLK